MIPRCSRLRLRFLLCFIFYTYLHSLPVNASSQRPQPLTGLDHPVTLALEILPRHLSSRDTAPRSSPTLRHSDHFRLTISAFDQTFRLHLRPNDDLIHSAARIRYYSTPPGGGPTELRETLPILRENVLAYVGEVVHNDQSEQRMREDASRLWRHPSDPSALGWARIMVHHQGDDSSSLEPSYEGAFSFDGDIYHIMRTEKYMRVKHEQDPHVDVDDSNPGLVIFRDSDVAGSPVAPSRRPTSACAHDHLPFNRDPIINPLLRPFPTDSRNWWSTPWKLLDDASQPFDGPLLGKRQDAIGGDSNNNFIDSIGSTAGCPVTPKILYMGVATDCQYTSQHGSVQNATTTILTNWNTASGLYKQTFNVSLGIITLEVHDGQCPDPPDSNRPWNVACGSVGLNDRLSLFSRYRGTLGDDGAGLWHLMSGCPTGTEVGVAWLGTLCTQRAAGQGDSVVSGTAVSTAGRTEWQVVAHEIGHNFGAIHDCQSGCNTTTGCCPLSAQTCDANSQYLMSPVTSAGEMNFSPCSIGNVCSLMRTGLNQSCLIDPGANSRPIISLQMCGNGIVEQGEDCDPGSGQTSNCCDASTCKFTNNAVCDPANDECCTDTCQLAPSSKVCRPAITGGCDIEEKCTGTSAKCPQDTFVPNGQSCGPGELACANGQCTSVAQQCATVGMSMNLTKACPARSSRGCQISCQSPRDPAACVILQAQLVDGSPCGYGGTCTQGNCVSGPILNTVKSWYLSNLQISIPITVVVGIVAILILWSLILMVKRCCARAKPQRQASTSSIPGPGQRIPSWTTAGPPLANPAIREAGGFAPRHQPPPPQPVIPTPLRVGPVYDRESRRYSNRPVTNWVDPSPWNGR